MIGDAQLAIPPGRWRDAIHMLQTQGLANYTLYAAIDYCLACQAAAGDPDYHYPALAAQLERELAVTIGRRIRKNGGRW